VLFDMPRDPAELEQRIGRLDRVTRQRPIEIVYFRPAGGFEAELVRLYEEIGVLHQPLGGLERSLGRIAAVIEKAASAKATASLPRERLAAEIRAEVAERERAVYHHLHQGGYVASLGPGLLARVPADLDARHEEFVVRACALLGLEAAEKKGARAHYFELGASSVVDSLPGVPGGTRYLGTFDRQEAVVREELEFFASGHPLVEGLLAELEDGSRGRSALLELEGAGESGVALVTLVDSGGGRQALEAVDAITRRPRPDWVKLLVERRTDLQGVAPEAWREGLPRGVDWAAALRALADRAKPVRAAAGVRLKP
jgi:ATP-dependent helicase HepA